MHPPTLPMLLTQFSSPSRLSRQSSSVLTVTRSLPRARALSLLAQRPPSLPFFTPPPPPLPRRSSKSQDPSPTSSPSPEVEVDDREWDMRVARAMLQLRETLPIILDPKHPPADLFPPDIFSQNVILKLPPPLPIKVSSLHGYSMAISLTRNGMQALHSDLSTCLERMTVASPSTTTPHGTSRRQRQIRVLLSVHGVPRLPPHKEATWQTSSLYTFSPYSGLIASHEVETIRPLPGEGVAEWLMSRLLGWTARHAESEGAIPCPRAVPYPRTSTLPSNALMVNDKR